MTVLPPRYLLREKAVLRLLRDCRPGRFLEIGYGNGEMLLTLARHGFHGVGYDSSTSARSLAAGRLQRAGVKAVELQDQLPSGDAFDYLMLFEVIGYLPVPSAYLRELSALMHDNSFLLLSFTNARHAGIAEQNSGNYACFDRDQMSSILAAAGLQCVTCHNYGYPVTNLLRPLLDAWFSRRRTGSQTQEVAQSGLNYRSPVFVLAAVLVNRLTLLPFAWLQHWFRHSDLGTGYVVLARKLP